MRFLANSAGRRLETQTQWRPNDNALGDMTPPVPLTAPRFKNVVFEPAADTPANSPRWTHRQGLVEVRLAQNTETGVYSAVAHVVDKPFGAAAEDPDHAVAIQAAVAALVDGVDNGAGNIRAETVVVAERDAFAALRDAA